MDQTYTRYNRLAEVERIVTELQKLQFVDPHAVMGEAMERAQRELGFCPQAGEEAMRRLAIDPGTKIGRLRKTELLQLARAIQRIWRAAVGSEAL